MTTTTDTRPEAVVVDYRDAFTWAKDADGRPFTVATAAAWAAKLNAECRPEHRTYHVHPLAPALTGTPCGDCGGGYVQPFGDVERFTEQYIPHAGFCPRAGVAAE